MSFRIPRGWPEEATDTFIKLATSEDDFLALIDDMDQRAGKWPFLISKGLEEDEITLNESFVNEIGFFNRYNFPVGSSRDSTLSTNRKNEDEQY